MHQVRAVTLKGYTELAGAMGLDARRILRQAGITPEAIEDPENRISAAAVAKVFEDSAELSGCDSFGLRLAQTRSFASLGPLSLLLQRLPNVREMIRAAIEFQLIVSDIIAISIEDSQDSCVIRLDLVPGHWSVQTCDFMMGVGYRVLREASGRQWRAARVHVVRKPPEDIKVWRQVFDVPMEFASDFNGFSCTQDAMMAPNPHADSTMAANARRLLQLIQVEALPRPLAERVRRSIVAFLPSGRVTIDSVASQLAMSRRSLQRGLQAEGQGFGALLDETRRNLATAYLADSTHPVTSVAALLGYQSPSAFTRWFGTSFGKSPQAWRKEAAG